MLQILTLLIDFCLDTDEQYFDPRSQNLILVSSLRPPIVISFTYLYFVKVLGPAWMKNRQPYTLKYPMMIYNVIQVVASALLAYKGFLILFANNKFSKWNCLGRDLTNTEYGLSMMQCMHYFYLLKILDLMDTVFFVLRKRLNQISFLHVYHHFAMVNGVYLALRYGFNGQPILLGFLNCVVHAIMYFYYFMSSIRPSMKNSLWWKKYITQLQMIQFTMNMIHFSAAFFKKDCTEPKLIEFVMVVQNFFMLIMFGDFYMKAYIKKSNPSKMVT